MVMVASISSVNERPDLLLQLEAAVHVVVEVCNSFGAQGAVGREEVI